MRRSSALPDQQLGGAVIRMKIVKADNSLTDFFASSFPCTNGKDRPRETTPKRNRVSPVPAGQRAAPTLPFAPAQPQ